MTCVATEDKKQHADKSAKLEVEVGKLQKHMRFLYSYLKPIVRTLFSAEAWPTDAGDNHVIDDRVKRLMGQIKHVVKTAGTYTGLSTLMRVKSHYPSVELSHFGDGVAANTTPQQLIA